MYRGFKAGGDVNDTLFGTLRLWCEGALLLSSRPASVWRQWRGLMRRSKTGREGLVAGV